MKKKNQKEDNKPVRPLDTGTHEKAYPYQGQFYITSQKSLKDCKSKHQKLGDTRNKVVCAILSCLRYFVIYWFSCTTYPFLLDSVILLPFTFPGCFDVRKHLRAHKRPPLFYSFLWLPHSKLWHARAKKVLFRCCTTVLKHVQTNCETQSTRCWMHMKS